MAAVGGWLVRWDDYAPRFQERAAPGGMRLAPSGLLTWTVVSGAGPALRHMGITVGAVPVSARWWATDEGLRVLLPIRPGQLGHDYLAAAVRGGTFRGWSVEFVFPGRPGVPMPRVPGRVNVIRGALVVGAALVANPAYPRSLAWIED